MKNYFNKDSKYRCIKWLNEYFEYTITFEKNIIYVMIIQTFCIHDNIYLKNKTKNTITNQVTFLLLKNKIKLQHNPDIYIYIPDNIC